IVSGFVTSPEDQSRICLLEASPIRIESNSLMSGPRLETSIRFSSPSLSQSVQFVSSSLFGRLELNRLAALDELLVGGEHELAFVLGVRAALLDLLGRRLARRGADRARREVDAELLGRAEELVVLLADLDLAALVREHLDVEAQRLHLLEQDLEALGDRRLRDVLALHDRLVRLDPADRVVGLDREHLLQRVRRAVRLERPHLHLAEALAAELRL